MLGLRGIQTHKYVEFPAEIAVYSQERLVRLVIAQSI